uniref:Uncharacterized protein n=1 Tax=Anguilla anguilla TaxID=7936 RepID=A0A0E9VVV7_ANGAN
MFVVQRPTMGVSSVSKVQELRSAGGCHQ